MTEKTEVVNEETDAITAMISNGFAALDVAEEEIATPADTPAEEEVIDEPAEEEAEEVSVDTAESEPAKAEKPLPRGKRAREEYEARVRLEIENDNLKKSIALLSSKKETPAATESDDDYLKAKGIDPDAFIDDAAKDAVIKQFRETDSLKELVQKTTVSNDEAQFVSYVNNIVTQLPDSAKQDLSGAIHHLVETEARSLLVDYPNASIEEARKVASESLNKTMLEKYKSGVNAVEWAYKMAQSRNYNGLTKPAESGKINAKNIAKSQERAGAPNIEKVSSQLKGEDAFSDSYHKELKALGVIKG